MIDNDGYERSTDTTHNKPIPPEALNTDHASPMMNTLGIRIKEIGESHAIIEVMISGIHGNYFGGAHGGLLATLVDTAAFFPRPLLPSGRACTTTNLSITYVRPAVAGDILTARSELVHLGRRLASVTVTILNQKQKLVAHGTASLMLH